MAALLQDVRYTLRSFRRNPVFAGVAVLTLGIGIGATAAVFRLVDAALLEPLPYADPDRLVVLHSARAEQEISMSFPDLRDLRDRTRSLAELAGFAGTSFNLTVAGVPERLAGQLVTADLFTTLGVAPALGRGFLPGEEGPGGPRVAVLSDALWRRSFAGDARVVGTTVSLDGEPFTVVGVMPPGFDFPGGIVYGAAEVWVPAGLRSAEWSDRGEHPGLYAVGRLAPGVSLEGARRELAGLAAQLAAEHPGTNDRIGVVVRGALESLVGDSRPALLLLLGAVALMLLLACVNVSSLVLARATSRAREMAVRAALGAGRARLTGQLLVEGLVLATMGGALGLLVALAAGRAAAPLLAGLPRLETLPAGGRVAAFMALVVGASAVLFGLVPALSRRSDLARRLRDRAGDDPGGARARALLSGAQVALAVALLIGAGLLVGGYARTQRAESGIEPEGVLTLTTSLPASTYGEMEEPAARFYRELHARLEALPGVRAVGGISVLPFSGAGAQSGISLAGSDMEPVRTDVASVTPGYFEAMGVRLLRGRRLTPRDGPELPVAVVDERFATRFWPGQDPIGERVQGWGYRDLTVVGVVAHVKNYGVTAESREELFVPHALRPANRLVTVVRATGDPAALAPAVRRVVGELDPALPVYSIRTMREVVDATVSTPRLTAALTSAFAAVALVLAVVGVYGITAYAVVRRRREIGIRLALGASAAGIFRLVLRQALTPAGLGAAVGILGALAGSRLLASQVVGVGDGSAALYLALPAGLLLVVTLASALPARHAARVDPLEMVRE